MAGPETEWIHIHASKIDRWLRQEVLVSYEPPKRVPRSIGRFLVPLRLRYRRLPVIIQLHKDCTRQDCEHLSRKLNALGCKNTRVLHLIGAVAASVPIAGLTTVVEDSRVARISYDRQVRALLDVAAPTVFAPDVWKADLTGAGVAVAVIDTGVHPHEDFLTPDNRIVGFADFIRNRRIPYDDNGHGTHVAGIVAGNGARSDGKYKGIAPGAALVGVKVLDATGNGNLSTVIQGIQWSVENQERFGIRVLNLSLGAPAQDSYRDDPVAQAVEAAWERGLVVCAAAGNEGPDAMTISTPGIHPKVITVGASDDKGSPQREDDTVPDFSSRGPTVDGISKPDLVVPGTNIVSTNSPNSTIAMLQRKRGADYIALSGTSMATPVCSGIVALMLQGEPDLTPDDVKERLVETAESLGIDANIQGSGLASAIAAVNWAAAHVSRSPGEPRSHRN